MLKKVIESSSLLVIQQLFQKLIGVVSTVILARLLTPEDFGIVAIAMLVFWFADAITATGTNLYIVQKESVSDPELNSSWTLDLILKSVTYGILVGVSWFYAVLNDDAELALVIVSVGSLILLSAVRNPGLLLLKREQNYRKMVAEAITTKALAVCISIPAALILKNHWALVLSLVLSSAFSAVMSYKISTYRPSLAFKHIPVQWNFSKWLIPQAVIGFLRSHIDTAIVGARFPASDLGGYNTTKYFAFLPVIVLINPLTAPLHAELGKVQSATTELKRQFDITTRIIGFVIAPIISSIFVFSEGIMMLILGEQWIKYSSLLGYFAVTSASMALLQQSTRLAMVNKRTKLIFVYELVSSLIIVSLLAVIPIESIFVLAIFKVVLELCLTVFFYQYIYYYNFNSLALKNLTMFFVPTILSTSVLLYAMQLGLNTIPLLFYLGIGTFFAFLSVFLVALVYLLIWADQNEVDFVNRVFAAVKERLRRSS